MHDTGIVRRVDDLGRIVIPMELRRTLGIKVKDPMAIFVEGDRIILTKHKDACALCGGDRRRDRRRSRTARSAPTASRRSRSSS